MTDQDVPVVLVTGASRGIGLEVSRALAADGTTVLVSARSEEAAARAAREVGDGAVPLVLDVADDASVTAAAARVEAEQGRLDVLVNNAAAFVDWSQTITTADLDGVRTVLETNVLGPWRTSRAFLPLLRRSPHPRIVNVSSGGGSHGDTDFGLAMPGGAAAPYGVSKAALNALTAKLAAELADTPVLVNAVCPGLTATAPGMEAMGARPVAEGAASVLWGVRLPDDGPRGGFFRDGRPLPW